jgi:signal transduction histidine kinase
MLETGLEELSQGFESVAEILSLSLQSADSAESKQALEMIAALRQNIQIMLRLSSDVTHNKQPDLSVEEISKIADYALNLLDEISQSCASRGMQEEMLKLHRLSLPVVHWLETHGGQVKKLDVIVNAIASYANTLQDKKHLEILCRLISSVVNITEASISQDLEVTNPMRPWRILNLNWGIVATRTHNLELMQQVFDQLIKNIPADSQQFFNEGMQQMDIVGYPQPVRDIMQKYAGGFGADGVLH